jgi:integrase
MRKGELYNVKLADVKDVNSALIVDVPYTKTKKPRKFVITDNFYSICKEYINFQKGKCTRQVVGINKFGKLVQDIAKFLKLPHPEKYTGHTYRRTSPTIVADKTGDLLALKRHGGWQSSGTAEGYVNDSMNKKLEICKHIIEAVDIASTSTSTTVDVASTSDTKPPPLENIQNILSEENKINSLRPINFHNCHNLTINFNQ